VCDSSTRKKLFAMNGFDIARCSQCGFVFTNPIPTDGELADYYNTCMATAPVGTALVARRSLGRTLKNLFIVRLIKRFFPKEQKIRLLEIGFGQGDLLRALQNDPQVEAQGLDYSEANVAHARQQHWRAEVGSLESRNYPAGSFDAVVAIHVIEHLQNPLRTFAEIHRILRPGGMFIGVTPCVSHVKARLAGRKWKYFGPPGHLWYFAPKTLRLLLNKLGFDPLQVSCFYHRAHVRFFGRKR